MLVYSVGLDWVYLDNKKTRITSVCAGFHALELDLNNGLAEEVRFELTVGSHPRQFSRL